MNISLDIWTIWFYGCSMVDFNLQQSGGEFHGIIEVACEVRGSFVYVFFLFLYDGLQSHRIHGAGIYANITGVYWWDPCYHI